MRFDLICNMALHAEPGQRLHVQVLPTMTEQQRLLHEVIWVEGCDRWIASADRDGARGLDLVGCASEVRIAFAASVSLAPVWCHAAAIREQPGAGIAAPSAYSTPGERWSTERIVAALAPAARGPAAVFAALPELFEGLRHCTAANQLPQYARAPSQSTDCAAQRTLEPLQFAITVFRALGVPARIVAGFAPEAVRLSPHDARAFYLELYRAGRWWLFEPDGHVPAFGFVRTKVGSQPSDLALVRGVESTQALRGVGSPQALRMDASVDPPPEWGLPLRTSSRLLLSLDAQAGAGAQSGVSRPVVPATALEASTSV